MRMARWIVPVAGVAALVVLFLVLRPGGDGAEPDRSPTPSPAVTEPTPTPTVTPETTPSPILDAVEIEVEEGRVEGPSRIEVTQGERVGIEVKADVTDEVHVHGYELLEQVRPGRDAVIRFRADIPGVFEVELEESGILLIMIEVSP